MGVWCLRQLEYSDSPLSFTTHEFKSSYVFTGILNSGRLNNSACLETSTPFILNPCLAMSTHPETWNLYQLNSYLCSILFSYPVIIASSKTLIPPKKVQSDSFRLVIGPKTPDVPPPPTSTTTTHFWYIFNHHNFSQQFRIQQSENWL